VFLVRLEGIYAPIPTPFKEEKIHYPALEENLAAWGDSRLAGLVVLGSNGEFVLLEEDEKVELVGFVRRHYPRPVAAGTGCESTQATIRLTRRCADVGADAALVVNPCYYKGSMTDSALRAFYTDVAEASPVPVILYNMPRNTGINLSASLVKELSSHPNIIGIKDSSGNISQIAELISGSAPGFSVFAGSGSFLYASLCLGATGGTLAVANVLPTQCDDILALCAQGQHEEARKAQMRILEANAAVTTRWGVAGLKAAMDLLGLYGGNPRKPLLPLAQEARLELRAILQRAGVL
jgi:4-hydroxy-2-oxoglutarate aldolase